MSVTATVTTSSGSLALNSTPYFLDAGADGGASGFDMGQVQLSRVWATSVYVAGGVLVFAVPGIAEASLKVYAQDTTQSAVQSDIDALIVAFTATTYTLTLDMAGATYAWTCYAADYAVDPWPPIAVVGLQLGVTFTIPRYPVPLLGPV